MTGQKLYIPQYVFCLVTERSQRAILSVLLGDYKHENSGSQRRDIGLAIKQMEMAVLIAEVKYPKKDGWRHVWIFDYSSCQSAMAEDQDQCWTWGETCDAG